MWCQSIALVFLLRPDDLGFILPLVNQGSYLVDPASSHMLVSKIKPCTPQNHCIAGICAWLITSDVICRKYFAVYRKIGYLGETPS